MKKLTPAKKQRLRKLAKEHHALKKRLISTLFEIWAIDRRWPPAPMAKVLAPVFARSQRAWYQKQKRKRLRKVAA